AIASAKDLKDGPQLVAWCDDASGIFGEDLFLAFARALGAGLCGDRAGAIARLRGLVAKYPDEAGMRPHLASLLIADGAWDEAEAHLLEASKRAPLDQSTWAYLSIVWRLKNDAREFWLADYERLVQTIDLPLDEGALDALTRVLAAMHLTRHHPLEQSPRGGTQTRGILFERRAPEIVALAAVIKDAVEARLATLPDDPAHPFLSRKTKRIAFAGSWSVRLASAGRHASHIHHAGWLSSACYIDLPPEVASPAVDAGAATPGALLFGVPDESLGLALTPRRVVVPARGKLAIFPSYFWHGTEPFESRRHRLTVAFDASPRPS
ncbi:MAG: tetratricopeptide repeat protein, partial [Parvularculaceae bacterium]|nr:tetratricopeptide repeat protein [Parvularculaceae bacterium]